MFGFNLDLRDVLLVLAGLVTLYFVFIVLRLIQFNRRRNALSLNSLSPDDIEPETDRPEFSMAPEPAVPRRDSPADDFVVQLQQRVEGQREGARLNLEVEQLRAELESLRDEIDRLKAERNVSPLYNEAMSLATQGLDANGVATRCGISVAEAELVVALTAGKRREHPEHFEERHERAQTRRVA
ncbi:MAG TPA: DUF2802 domain-containing protein [Rhodocyclaceae bacterium]